MALGVIIPVDKNKPKPERLFSTIYLKRVYSIISNPNVYFLT